MSYMPAPQQLPRDHRCIHPQSLIHSAETCEAVTIWCYRVRWYVAERCAGREVGSRGSLEVAMLAGSGISSNAAVLCVPLGSSVGLVGLSRSIESSLKQNDFDCLAVGRRYPAKRVLVFRPVHDPPSLPVRARIQQHEQQQQTANNALLRSNKIPGVI